MPAFSGIAINKTLEPGTTITLRFTFYDNDGNPLGSEDVEVTISDPEVAHTFQLTFEAEMQVLGYSYEFRELAVGDFGFKAPGVPFGAPGFFRA